VIFFLLSTNLNKQTGSPSILPIPQSWVPAQSWVLGAAKGEIEWHEAYPRISKTRKSAAMGLPETRGCRDILDTFCFLECRANPSDKEPVSAISLPTMPESIKQEPGLPGTSTQQEKTDFQAGTA
jgi:hypothetical protein